MEHQGLPAKGKASRLKPSSQELMAAARQARAEGLYNMISELGRRLRSIVAIHLLSARVTAAGDSNPSELHARPDT